VKHIYHVSKGLPAAANEFQFIVCQVSHSMWQLMDAKGATTPVLDWVNTKCDLPDAQV